MNDRQASDDLAEEGNPSCRHQKENMTSRCSFDFALSKRTFDALESAAVRSAHPDGSFLHRYRYLMEELQTYSFDADTCRARVLNTIEAEVRRMFLSEEAFGLKENNTKKTF